MGEAYLISHVLIWALVLIQSALILVLARQVGVLHLRVHPAGARVIPVGPPIGTVAPRATLTDIEGKHPPLEIAPGMPAGVVLLFVSSSCVACEDLLPAIRPVMRETSRELRWALIVRGKRPFLEFRRNYGLDFLLVAQDPAINELFQVSQSPYTVIISKDGMVLAKGITNTMEHLESLIESRFHIAAMADELTARDQGVISPEHLYVMNSDAERT
jgi:methylamine dehydrogenase accessory protein MauD